MSRPASRAGSLLDPLSDAEALAAAQAAPQPQASQDSNSSAAPTAEAQGPTAASRTADALGNEQLVWEMLYNPDYSLPATDAVAAWHRAMGREPEEEEVSCCGRWFPEFDATLCLNNDAEPASEKVPCNACSRTVCNSW